MIETDAITGLVLAGGLGRRMGGVDKGLQQHRGVPLARHALARLAPQVGRIAINANRHLEAYRAMGSLEFSKHLLAKSRVSVSPGIGFGEFGDGHVRFALIENESRSRQAIRGIKQMFRDDGLL